MEKKKVHCEFEKFLLQDLREDRELTRAYLNEALKGIEYCAFLLSIHYVIEAYGGREEMSKKSGIAVEKLDHIFEEKEAMDQQTFAAILSTFGWKLSQHEPHIVPHTSEANEAPCSSDFPLLAAFGIRIR